MIYDIYIYNIYNITTSRGQPDLPLPRSVRGPSLSETHAAASLRTLAFTRYWFTWKLLCTNQSFFYRQLPPVPTLSQCYCTSIAQYTTPPPTPHLYAIHNTILVVAISCKGQSGPRCSLLVRSSNSTAEEVISG